MATKLLIYDGQCAYCRGFVRLIRWLDFQSKVRVLPFEDHEAQAILRAQFGDSFGFAMFLFEEERVSWGQEAAKRIVQTLSLPGARLAFWLYPSCVRLVSWLTRRKQTVCGPECAGLHGSGQTASLKPNLKPQIEQLLRPLSQSRT